MDTNESNSDAEQIPLDDALIEPPEEATEEAPAPSTYTDVVLGRTFDDETGRIVSSRARKPVKLSQDFVHK